MSGYNNGIVSPKKPERKVSLVFKHTTSDQHVAGIESLAVSPDSSCLYTASRDSLVKRWRVDGGKPSCEATLEGHVDWVNDVLLLAPDRLATCSSDRTVKVWQAGSGSEVRCLHTVQHHSDYVTCLAASAATGKMVSAGLNGEVILYDSKTLQAHLLMPYGARASGGGATPPGAAAAAAPAGLADAAAAGPPGSAPPPAGSAAAAAAGSGGSTPPPPAAAQAAAPAAGPAAAAAQAPMRSAYALDMAPPGTAVAVGTTEHHIRVLDPRSGTKVAKLKGHTDNIRCLLFNADGSLLLSGSSDNSVRLWDLRGGGQRCIQTLNVHTDSVWCLAASPDFSAVFSGGRDRAVYCTHLGQRKAWLLAREQQPVRDIALAGDGSRLWVATTSSSVNGYDVPGSLSCSSSQQQGQQQQQQRRRSGRRRQEAAAAEEADADAAEPLDMDEDVADEGDDQHDQQQQQQQQRLRQQHHAPQQVPPPPLPTPAQQPAAGGGSVGGLGAGASNSLGRAIFGTSPSVRLRHSFDPGSAEEEVPLAAPAVVIPGSPGLAAVRVLVDRRHLLTQDTSGQVQLWDVLSGQPIQGLGPVRLSEVEARLFRPLYVEPWFSADVRLGCLALHLEPPKCFAAEAYALDLGVRDVPDDQKVNLGACLLRSAFATWAHRHSKLYLSGAPLPGLDDPGSEQLPHFNPALQPAVVSTTSAGVAWRLSCGAFTGREREGDDLPAWVGEAVLRGLLPYVKELKAAFVLHPAEGSSLPSLLQSRLNAPRILQVMKVANYCVTKLAELNVPLCTHAVGLSPDSQAPPGSGQQQYLELTCNGLAVPYSLSIATVKRLLWKRSDDVIFHYRVLDPARLAPFPAFGPPETS